MVRRQQWTGQQTLVCRKDTINDTVRVTLGMEDIWSREGLELTEDEVKKEFDEVLREAKENEQELDQEKLMEQVVESLKVHHLHPDSRAQLKN